MIYRYPEESRTSRNAILMEDVFTIAEEWQLPELHRAVLKLTSQSLSSLVLERHTAINAVDLHGRTALWWATIECDVEAVQTLLERGADPNIKDDLSGYVPLHWAAQNLHMLKMWKFLLRHGADATVITKESETVFHSWVQKTKPEAISLCEQRDFVSAGVALGTPLDACDGQGYTAVAGAVRNDLTLAVKALLECGADYTIASDDGVTILHLAAMLAGLETLNALAAHGLPGIDIDRREQYGYTALELFELDKGNKTPQQIVAFYEMWRKVSLKARRNRMSGPAVLVIEELDSEEDSFSQGAEGLQGEDGEEGSEEGSEDGDEEDVFVDAPAF